MEHLQRNGNKFWIYKRSSFWETAMLWNRSEGTWRSPLLPPLNCRLVSAVHSVVCWGLSTTHIFFSGENDRRAFHSRKSFQGLTPAHVWWASLLVELHASSLVFSATFQNTISRDSFQSLYAKMQLLKDYSGFVQRMTNGNTVAITITGRMWRTLCLISIKWCIGCERAWAQDLLGLYGREMSQVLSLNSDDTLSPFLNTNAAVFVWYSCYARFLCSFQQTCGLKCNQCTCKISSAFRFRTR